MTNEQTNEPPDAHETRTAIMADGTDDLINTDLCVGHACLGLACEYLVTVYRYSLGHSRK